MTIATTFEIFLSCAPGLEPFLAEEAREKGFQGVLPIAGGVTVNGGWPDIWRANLELRGTNRITVRIAQFRVLHLAQLDKRARRVPWFEVLRRDVPFSVEVTCKTSRVYHSDAAAERITRAINEELGAPFQKDAPVTVMARIENDLCTVSVDTSGELLHKRGFKESVNAAPMRETMAALFLRQCGYDGREPVIDPMCGSGTFVIEAAEIANGLKPGRLRSFAFEHLATFHAPTWTAMRAQSSQPITPLRFIGSDRDEAAVRMSQHNAERAGVAAIASFHHHKVNDLKRPGGPTGLVIVNPPYGDRIGDKSKLSGLYRSMGETLRAKFSGWRVGVITTERALARATGLPFLPTSAPVPHGGLRVTLYRTARLP